MKQTAWNKQPVMQRVINPVSYVNLKTNYEWIQTVICYY